MKNEKDNALVPALAAEFKRIEDTLAKIGYTVINLDFEHIGLASRDGKIPDLRIWARSTENL
jgi:hypothetical protein